MLLEEGLDGLREVLQDMPAVRDLDGFRGSLSSALGVGGTAIPADDLHPWMLAQPGPEGLPHAAFQEIDDLMAIQIVATAACRPSSWSPPRRPGLCAQHSSPTNHTKVVGVWEPQGVKGPTEPW